MIVVASACILGFSQGGVVLTFTGRDAVGQYVRSDSIVVENLTRHWTETMYWPDTVLTLNVGTGVENQDQAGGITVFSNPFAGSAQMEVSVAETGIVQMRVSDELVELVFIQDGSPCPGAATMTDIDGNVYNTVHIGDQCWMRENLRVTRYENGDSIF